MNKPPLYWIFFLFAFCTSLCSCEWQFRERNTQISAPKDEALAEEDSAEAVPPPLFINYHLDSLASKAEVDSLKVRYSEDNYQLILALNRIDAHRLGAGDKIILPDTLTKNVLDYSPFPGELELLDSLPKAVLISLRVQAFGLYENGQLKRWGPVSSGKESTPTPAGLFYGNYKARSKTSSVDEDWILPYYFNFLNFDGVGVHQYSMPGYPASHACVRLFEEDAKAIYHWADQWQLDSTGRKVLRNGTPFMVFGSYDFDNSPPWLQLAENPTSNYLTSSELETLSSYMAAYFKDTRNFELAEKLEQ